MVANTPAPEPSSVLLYGGTVPSFGSTAPALRGCEMLVQRGVVASLGRSLTLMPGTRLLDITNHLVIPGLVAPGSLASKGRFGLGALGEDEPPTPTALDDESAHALGLYAAAKALLGGVTTVSDGSLESGSDGLGRALREAGMRVAAEDAASEPSETRELGLAGLRGAEDAERALMDATLGAAKSLGLAGEVGSLTPGKWADVVILAVDPGELESTPDEGLADLALSDRTHIRHVLIAGASVVTDGKLVHHDLDELEREAQAKAAAFG